MSKSLARTVVLFGNEKPKFAMHDKIAGFFHRPPIELYEPQVRYDDLIKHYGIGPTNYREKTANLMNPGVLENYKGETLNLNWVTSIDDLAARAGYFSKKAGKPVKNPFFQLMAIGVVKTSDDEILLGVRGGEITPERVDSFASGLYGLLPTGSVKFKSDYRIDPMTDTVEEEFSEEVGSFSIIEQTPIGVFEAEKPGPTGYKFVSMLKADASLKEIQEANMRANELYARRIEEGVTKEDVSVELRDRGLPPDAWEHSTILGLSHDPSPIRKLVNAQPQSFSGIGAGALNLFAEYLESL